MSTPAPDKRAAFESARDLARRLPYDPDMPRPAATSAGAGLVFLRVIAGVVWLASVVLGWDAWVASLSDGIAEAGDDPELTSAAAGLVLTVIVAAVGIAMLVDAVFAVLIYRGRNGARLIVMTISTLSITGSFLSWWVQGRSIHFDATFITLALDILVLLALSSRSAAAYARRLERPLD